MNECKLVEDLLPLYAEELVSEETAEFIRDHSARCARCGKLLQRCEEVEPMKTQNDRAYQKALRLGILKTSLKGAAVVVLILALVMVLVVVPFIRGIPSKGEPVVYESPDGVHRLEVSYWPGICGFGEGLSVDTKARHSSSSGTLQNMREILSAEWSPDGTDLFLTVLQLNGETGMYLWFHEYDFFNENGDLVNTGGWLPREWTSKEDGNYYDLTDVLEDACAADPDFPTGWETITFTFDHWDESGDVVYLNYETDQGDTGVVTYDYYAAVLDAVENWGK